MCAPNRKDRQDEDWTRHSGATEMSVTKVRGAGGRARSAWIRVAFALLAALAGAGSFAGATAADDPRIATAPKPPPRPADPRKPSVLDRTAITLSDQKFAAGELDASTDAAAARIPKAT